jgi:hypothetical protein
MSLAEELRRQVQKLGNTLGQTINEGMNVFLFIEPHTSGFKGIDLKTATIG